MNETPNEFFSPLDEEAEYVSSPWRENQGNFLAVFTLLIVLVGSGVLACRQLRFVPPRFPESRAIPPPEDDPESKVDPSTGVTKPGKNATSEAGGSPEQTKVVSSSVPDTKEMVTLEATGADDEDGAVMFAIYDSAANFNKVENAFRRERVSINGGKALVNIVLDDLPERFAVAVYHDRNGNGSLDRNALGIPSERYGFSNNARSLTGPPAYSQAAVERPSAGGRVEVRIR